MKKILTLFLALVVSKVLWANIITGQCGDHLDWSYDTQTKALSITGYGDMFNYDYSGNVPWATISPEITSISLPNELTSIGDNAFTFCGKITNIQIPETVESIGQDAFSFCNALTFINIPSSVEIIAGRAFYACDNLQKINIQEGVQSIGYWAFYACYSLSKIILPSTLVSLESGALEGIKEIHCLATTPPTISSSSIDADAIVYVLCDYVNHYLAAQYWQFLNIIGDMDYDLSFGVSGNGSAKLTQSVCSMNIAIVEATPSAGWLFDKWSDGNTDNPRTISLTKDTVLTPLFKKSDKQYTINLLGIGYAEIEGYGSFYQSSISQTVTEGTYVYFYAISDCGIFEGWSDGVTTGDRGIRVTSDTTIYAIYSGIETYHVSITAGEHGRLNQEIVGEVSSCASSFHFETTPDEGYHFIGWSDGYEYSWRTINIYQDTILTALFAKGEFGGKCGNNLYWSYEVTPSALTITGEGEMEAFASSDLQTWRSYNYDENPRYYWLSNIKTISLPDGLINIDYLAFKDCRHLQNITIPASVVEIEESAFEDCRSLQSVTFDGTNLHSIRDWAFYNCHALQHIEIPKGVTEIGDGAFYGCTYLEDLVLPASVTAIGDNGFALCSKLNKMTVKSLMPPTIYGKTFYDVSRQMPVYVPMEVVNDYKSDVYWGEMNIIGVEMPTDFESVHGSQSTTHKVLCNGQLLIEANNATYTLMGQKVR